MNKKGQVGDSIVTMYRVFLVIVIAVVILGASAVVYSYSINVRDTEAMLMIRQITECVAPGSLVELKNFDGVDSVFEYCGFDENEVERFFISVSVMVEGNEVFGIKGGDAGLLWVRDVYSEAFKTKDIALYEPGHFKETYGIAVLDKNVEKEGLLYVEVIVNAE